MRKILAGLASAALLVGLLSTTAGAARQAPTITSQVVAISGDSGFDANDGDFDVLREALVATGLDGALASKGQFTVFAPTDGAFIDLASFLAGGPVDEETAFDLVAGLGLDYVTDVLLYHVAPDRNPGGKLKNLDSVPTLFGESLDVDSASLITDAVDRDTVIIAPDAVKVSNGVVHVIGGVLLPYLPA